MDRASWDRRAPLTGALFAVIYAIAYFLFPTSSPPKASDSGATWTTYVTGHRDALLWRGYLVGIALVLFLWFVSALGTRLRARGEGRLASTMFAGGVVLGTIAILQSAATTWIAYDHGAGLDGSTLKAILNGPQLAYAFPWAVFVGAASIASWRSKMVPSWLSVYGVVLTVWILVTGATYAHSGFFSPTGWFGKIAIIAFLIGTFVAGGWLAMHPEGEEQMSTRPAMGH
jgi:hypothetical protein